MSENISMDWFHACHDMLFTNLAVFSIVLSKVNYFRKECGLPFSTQKCSLKRDVEKPFILKDFWKRFLRGGVFGGYPFESKPELQSLPTISF